jgi:Ca-activated chloride channel family protein
MLETTRRARRIDAIAMIFLALLLFAPRVARALQVEAITQDGSLSPEGSLVQLFQEMEVAIHDQVAATRTTFQFRNDHDQEVELGCRFSLERGEMVDGFSYWNGEEQVVGEVLEKQAATRVYRKLTGVRRDPGILEQEGNRFLFRVYPVKAGETKPVEVRTVTPLSMREGWVEYAVPVENLPADSAVFSLKVDVTDDLPIRDLSTPGYRSVVKKFGPRHQRVVIERKGAEFEKDLVVRYRLTSRDHAMRFVTHRQGNADGTFMLLVSPKDLVREGDVLGRDIVFVTDISGSMEGTPLTQTRSGLKAILGQLNAGDRFDIISFDDESYPLFGELRPADGPNLRAGRDAVSKLESKGGTNIHGALLRALDQLKEGKGGRPRAVIFLTDGQGGTPPEKVLADVRARSAGVRIYSFGAGHGVNRFFLERLSDDNRGIATFIRDDRHIEREMKRLYDRISMPLMVDLELEFEGPAVHSLYPKRLPDLYRDGEVVVMGRYSKPGRGRVKLTGRVAGKKKTLGLDVVFPPAREQYATVEKLWASRRTGHLLASINLRGHDEETVREVTRLGIVYNLVTPFTTFLAVPASLKTDEIKEQIRQGRRGYDRKLIDSMQGVRLSQSHIPPGDPVLTVNAPEDARRVVAYFPFGLIKRLRWDEIRGRWHVRFLVPRDVEDGVYTIRIQVVHRDNTTTWKRVRYTIDGTAPEFETMLSEFAERGQILTVEVDPFEPVAEVFAYLPGVSEERVHLKLDPETGLYVGKLSVPEDLEGDRVTVRVVVRDLARNRLQRDHTLPLLPFDDDYDRDDLEEGAL